MLKDSRSFEFDSSSRINSVFKFIFRSDWATWLINGGHCCLCIISRQSAVTVCVCVWSQHPNCWLCGGAVVQGNQQGCILKQFWKTSWLSPTGTSRHGIRGQHLFAQLVLVRRIIIKTVWSAVHRIATCSGGFDNMNARGRHSFVWLWMHKERGFLFRCRHFSHQYWAARQ